MSGVENETSHLVFYKQHSDIFRREPTADPSNVLESLLDEALRDRTSSHLNRKASCPSSSLNPLKK
jgi:hypothetical protein